VDTGNLTKLRIESYSDEAYNTLVGEFVAMFNPNKYATRYEIEYGNRQGAGTSANAPSFSNMKPQELALEFFLDGTGVATGTREDVKSRVDDFLDKAYAYDGNIHRNRYLRILWGTLVFDCVLQAADVTFTLFDSQGNPLRAKINGKFLGFVNDSLRERQEDARSPDVTHVHVVQEVERIDQITYRVYRTPEYYIDVARANGLTHFRKLRAGQQILLPPVVKEAPDAR
jgi:hypothetical protein